MARKGRPAEFFAADSRAGARMRGSLSGALQQLREDVQTKALRSAVYAGAKVLTDELEVRVAMLGGGDGTLKKAIYTHHDDKRSGAGQQVYQVGVNKVKAPHWFNVEYGHWRVNVVVRGPNGRVLATKDRLPTPVWTPAHPYLRPTADRMPEAVRAMQRRLVQRVRELMRSPDEVAA
jgi:hypothetical protein